MIIYGLILAIHVVLAFFLIAIVLLQGGRGGLGETLGGAAAQSLFGGGANTVMARLTTICAGVFMVTSLSMAILSTARGRSVMEQLQDIHNQLPMNLPFPTDQTPEEPAPEAASKPASSSESAAPASVPPAARNAPPAPEASKKTE